MHPAVDLASRLLLRLASLGGSEKIQEILSTVKHLWPNALHLQKRRARKANSSPFLARPMGS